ncbi:hypothetical protein BN1723_016785, partial [Verticillium longisporum]
MRRLQGDAIRGLPARHRDRFMEMSPGVHGGDVGFDELVERVMATNSFDVDTDDGVRDDEFFAAFVETARMNHDCRPNVDYRFDPSTLTQRTTAIRDILPGEELTLSYIDPLQARDARRARLSANWGFDCTYAGSNPWSQTPTNCYHNLTLNSDFCVYTSSRVANGKGTAIITDNLRAAHLARAVALLADATDDPLVHAGSHKPINVQNAKYKIVPIPGKDLGAVATERIVRGEIILQETVSLLIDYAAFGAVPRDEMRRLQGDAVRGLPARHRDRFMDMSPGAHGGDVGFDELVER